MQTEAEREAEQLKRDMEDFNKKAAEIVEMTNAPGAEMIIDAVAGKLGYLHEALQREGFSAEHSTKLVCSAMGMIRIDPK